MLRLSRRKPRMSKKLLRSRSKTGFSLRRRYEAGACKADGVWRLLRASPGGVRRERRVRPVWWDLLHNRFDDYWSHRRSAQRDQSNQRRGLPNRTTGRVDNDADYAGAE